MVNNNYKKVSLVSMGARNLSLLSSVIFLSACQNHQSSVHDTSPIGKDFLPSMTMSEVSREEPTHESEINESDRNTSSKLIEGEPRTFVKMDKKSEPVGNVVRRGGDIKLNFSELAIDEAAQVILGDHLGKEFTVNDDVRGVVSFNGQGGLHKEDLIPVLEVLLGSQDAQLVKIGDGYRIVKGAANQVIYNTKGLDLIPLRYMSADSFVTVLASHGVTATAIKNGNMVAINESAKRIREIRELSKTFDVNWFRGQSVGIYNIQNTTAEQVQKDIKSMFGKDDDDQVGSVRLLPVSRNNALMVIGASRQAVEEVGRWVEELDKVTAGDDQSFYVYRVKNGKASDLAKLANQMFNANPASLLDQDEGNVKGARPFVSSEPSVQSLRIIADEATNSVIVAGSPYHFALVKKAMKELDARPLQVLVEARIMELSLTGELTYGLEWFLRGSRASSDTSGSLDFDTIGADLPIPGFNYVIERAGEIQTVLNAFADDSKLKVLSSPSLLVLNNRTARIQVGDEVPIPRVQSTSNFTPDAPTVNSIEYRDTGIVLEVTPRVNEGGMVTLDVSQEVSSVGRNTVSDIDAPIIQQRKLSSTIAVQNGQTVVLGGLIQERESTSDAGVPVLKNIPGLGKLFSTTSRNTRRTELVALLTPRVVIRQADFVQINEDYIESFQGLKTLASGQE
ncbi:type II secretion system secretin GspD [Arenicella sp. 4NH20-0111]|uniref:type II secretion system secretin GspD n=1 Tax=Arenicella sp. 4NH20-0111 TaxID=3127648 RepID=UPI003107DEEA